MTYFSVKGNYASSTKELWRVFPLKQQTFWPGSLLYEEAIKTSVITIWRATKFIAMLRPLHFNTKIHTCALKIFLLGKIYCRAGSKETFLKVGTLSVKARAYPRQIKTKNMNFKNAAISSCGYSVTMEILSFPFLFARKFSSMRTNFAAVSFAPSRAFVVHPISCGQEKWHLKFLLLALLAVNWKPVMMPWTCGRRKMLNVSFC